LSRCLVCICLETATAASESRISFVMPGLPLEQSQTAESGSSPAKNLKNRSQNPCILLPFELSKIYLTMYRKERRFEHVSQIYALLRSPRRGRGALRTSRPSPLPLRRPCGPLATRLWRRTRAISRSRRPPAAHPPVALRKAELRIRAHQVHRGAALGRLLAESRSGLSDVDAS